MFCQGSIKHWRFCEHTERQKREYLQCSRSQRSQLRPGYHFSECYANIQRGHRPTKLSNWKYKEDSKEARWSAESGRTFLSQGWNLAPRSVPLLEACTASLFSLYLLKVIMELFSLNKAAMVSKEINGDEGNFGMKREKLSLTGIDAMRKEE